MNNEELLKESNSTFRRDDVIDLMELLMLVKKKFYVFLILIVLGAGAAYAYAELMISPSYSSSGAIYLTPLVSSNGIADYNSMNSNSKLVSNVMSLLTQKDLLTEVAEASGMSSPEAVKRCLTISNDTDTEVIRIKATTSSPKLSKKIVTNEINLFIEMMKDNLNVKNIEIVDTPRLDFTPVGASSKSYAVKGAALGFVLAGGYVVLLLLTDNRLKSKEQVERYLGAPVIGEFPKM